VTDVVFRRDSYLINRWDCHKIKLWRLRKAGVLNSIQLGGSGPYLTSDEEILRVEALPPRKYKPRGIAKELAEGKGKPPDKAKAGPSVGAEGTGGETNKHLHPLDSDSAPACQAPSNGRAGT
jgi:hypothetical protein